MVEIKERNINDFFKTPFTVYGEDSLYISPLKSDLVRFLSTKNPLFNKYGTFNYFTAYKNNVLQGRIVAHIHRASNERHHIQRGYFGFFECVNDLEVAQALLSKAEEFSRLHGMQEIAGNFNFTAMQQIGVVTKGFEKIPYTDQAYNPPYTPELLKKSGYSDFFPMTTFELNLEKAKTDDFLGPKQKSLLVNPDYQFIRMTKKTLPELLEKARHLLNDGFNNNPMFVPVTQEEFMFQAQDMMYILDERISHMAFYKNEPAGVLVCIPDLNPLLKKIKSQLGLTSLWHYLSYLKNRNRAVIIFYSVAQKFHNQGINGALLYHTVKSLKEAHYKSLGLTWIADINTASLRQAERIHAYPYHKSSLFKKNL